jgi:hypothetical protein
LCIGSTCHDERNKHDHHEKASNTDYLYHTSILCFYSCIFVIFVPISNLITELVHSRHYIFNWLFMSWSVIYRFFLSWWAS